MIPVGHQPGRELLQARAVFDRPVSRCVARDCPATPARTPRRLLASVLY